MGLKFLTCRVPEDTGAQPSEERFHSARAGVLSSEERPEGEVLACWVLGSLDRVGLETRFFMCWENYQLGSAAATGKNCSEEHKSDGKEQVYSSSSPSLAVPPPLLSLYRPTSRWQTGRYERVG